MSIDAVRVINSVDVVTLQSSVTIAASGNDVSDFVDLTDRAFSGVFSLQVAISGDGTAKIEYLASNDGTNFRKPTNALDIATGLTKTSGELGDGHDIIHFEPELCAYIKIRVTETGGADNVTVTLNLAVR